MASPCRDSFRLLTGRVGAIASSPSIAWATFGSAIR
jgi:hypothetical protein